METLLQSIGFNVDIAHIAAPWLVTNGFDKAYLLDTTKWDERDRTAFRALEGINGGHMAQLNRFTPGMHCCDYYFTVVRAYNLAISAIATTATISILKLRRCAKGIELHDH